MRSTMALGALADERDADPANAVDGASLLTRGGDRCADAKFVAAGKPSGLCECNWACTLQLGDFL